MKNLNATSKNSIRKPHGKVTMLVQIPVALEELRQMMRVGAASHCEQCQAALSIVESIIATISGEPGSLADAIRPCAETENIKNEKQNAADFTEAAFGVRIHREADSMAQKPKPEAMPAQASTKTPRFIVTFMERSADSLKVGDYVYAILKGYDGQILVVGTQSSTPEQLSESAPEVQAALAAEDWDWFEAIYALGLRENWI